MRPSQREPTHANLPGVTDDDKRMIAGYLGGRKVDVAQLADAKLMPNQCPTNPAIDTLSRVPCGTVGAPTPQRALSTREGRRTFRRSGAQV